MAARGKVRKRSPDPERSEPNPTFFDNIVAVVRSRLTTVGILTAAAAGLWAFYSSDELQAKVCAVPALQPSLSDGCGFLGLGNRPTHAERLAWERVAQHPGSCTALTAHIAAYPEGAYRQRARDLLEARHVSASGPWARSQSTLDIYVPRAATPLASEAAARQAAISAAAPMAERECRKQSEVLQARFISARAVPEEWACDRLGSGMVCGFHGHTTCQIETPVEQCGVAQ